MIIYAAVLERAAFLFLCTIRAKVNSRDKSNNNNHVVFGRKKLPT